MSLSVEAASNVLNLDFEQKVSAAFARKIFAEKGDHYTCYYVGGNGATLDEGTWDVGLFLGALIKESKLQKKI